MKTRLITVFLFSFLFLFFTKNLQAVCVTIQPGARCGNLSYPDPECCSSSGCPTKCGDLGPWNKCYANQCCYDTDSTRFFNENDCNDYCKKYNNHKCIYEFDNKRWLWFCFYNYDFGYKSTSCDISDFCIQPTPFLLAGSCSSCGPGSPYKLCCEYNTNTQSFTGQRANCVPFNAPHGVCPTHLPTPDLVYVTHIPAPFTPNCPTPAVVPTNTLTLYPTVHGDLSPCHHRTRPPVNRRAIPPKAARAASTRFRGLCS